MPREIKTSIAVDGEAAFKRAINDANTSIRNMGTQLTLATAQFKKDGDAMKLVETRSKTLKDEIGQQEEIVKALEKAVKDSSTAFGENSEKTEKWEAELNRAKAKLVNLQSELTLNDAGLDRNGKSFEDSSEKAADYQATLETIGKGVSFENVTSGIGSITKGFESAAKKVISFANSLRSSLVDAGKWADDLITDATKYGLDVETMQRWQNAAGFIDTDVSTIINAKDKLAQKMQNGWTKKDGKNTLNLWDLYGIDITDAENGKYRDTMDVLFDVGELLMSIAKNDEAGGEVRADAVAMELFGKSYRELLPLFSAGRDEWEKTLAEQRVVSEEHVKALGEMDDANNQLENSWETLKYTALAELAPVLTEVTNALSGLLNELNDWLETDEGKEAMADLASSLQELFSGLGDIKFQDAMETAKTALNALRDALKWLADNKDNVFTALEVMAGGFALLKLSEAALNMGKIVSGFRTLWGGANKKLPTMPGADGGTPTTTGGGSESGTNLLTTTGAKVAGGALAFGLTLFKNAYTPQGNDDILDQNGNLTEDAKKSGYYLNDQGQVENKNNQPVFFEIPDEIREKYPTKEVVEDVDLDPLYTLSDKLEAVQDWWDAYRNAENGEDDWFEENQAFDYLQEVLGDQFGDFWDRFLEESEGKDLSALEDLPDNFTNILNDNASTLEDGVAQMKINTDSAKQIADKVAGADIKKFNGLPDEMTVAVQRGAAAGVSGIVVQIDGAAAGRLIAPYVNSYLGSMV